MCNFALENDSGPIRLENYFYAMQCDSCGEG
jgi:hypothetical protein